MTPLGLAGNAVLLAAEADDGPPDRPVADVDDARPADREGVDAQRVAVVEVVVEERAREVVGRADGVDVAGEVEVEVLHRDDLAVAAAGGAALDPEDRAERGLADRHRGVAPDPVEPLGQADRGRRLALAQRRGRDRRHEHVLPPRPLALDTLDSGQRHLGLRRAVVLDLVGPEAESGGDVADGPGRDRARDVEVGRERHGGLRGAVWVSRRAGGGAKGRPGRCAPRPGCGRPGPGGSGEWRSSGDRRPRARA